MRFVQPSRSIECHLWCPQNVRVCVTNKQQKSKSGTIHCPIFYFTMVFFVVFFVFFTS